MDNPILYKLVIKGPAKSGKSNIVSQYFDRRFNENYDMTIGVEFASKNINFENKLYKFQMWDTSGAEKFKSIVKSYYKGCQAMILVFDLTSQESFNEIKNNYDEDLKDIEEIGFKILDGNKTDLENERIVIFDDAESFAKSKGIGYIECSAKVGGNIEEIFMVILKHLNSQ